MLRKVGIGVAVVVVAVVVGCGGLRGVGDRARGLLGADEAESVRTGLPDPDDLGGVDIVGDQAREQEACNAAIRKVESRLRGLEAPGVDGGCGERERFGAGAGAQPGYAEGPWHNEVLGARDLDGRRWKKIE